jgi:hypothetical protein
VRFLLLSVTSSTVQGIFNVALYRYAVNLHVPPGFSKQLFRDVWTERS